MAYTIFRLNRSQYQDEKFIFDEKRSMESIPSVKYSNSISSLSGDDQIIIITTSNSDVRSIPQVILDRTCLLIHPNSGWDNIDHDFVRNNDFPMIIGNEIRANPVTEYILGSLFQHFTKILQQHHWDDERKWERDLIRNQKILVIGYGHIGSKVFDSLEVLCPNIFVVDPYKFENNTKNKLHELPKGFLSDTDVVIVCCHLTKETHHMIDQDFFNELKKPFLLINGARGKIVKQEALTHTLSKFPECHAYIDVFEKEPFNPGDFMGLKNIIKTSHIAGVHNELNQDIIKFEKKLAEDFIHAQNVSDPSNFLEKYQLNNIKNCV